MSGLHVGIDVNFSWTDDPNTLSYLAFDTLTSSGRNITSAVSDGLGDREAASSTIMLTASSDYTLYINITDTSLSADSDMPRFALLKEGGVTDVTALVSGLNTISFTTGATGQINMLFRGMNTKVIDVSADFALIAKNDDDDIVPIDVVTDEEWMFRRYDELTKPSSTYPIAKITGEYLYVLPEDIDRVLLNYLKQPTDPYFDYYTDANYNIQYLAASASYTLQTSEVYRDGTSSGTVTSATVELEWDDGEKIKILHRILAKMGVSMDEQLVAKYATSKENA
jgi:hypothetical protein